MTISKETKQRVFDMYTNTDKSVRTIAKECEVLHSSVSYIIKSMNGELRRPKKTRAITKKCPSCHRKIDLVDAKYCPYCATDIRSDKDIAIEKISRLAVVVNSLPFNQMDEATKLINEISRYIRNH